MSYGNIYFLQLMHMTAIRYDTGVPNFPLVSSLRQSENQGFKGSVPSSTPWVLPCDSVHKKPTVDAATRNTACIYGNV